MSRDSLLNPHAAPYVPLPKVAAAESSGQDKNASKDVHLITQTSFGDHIIYGSVSSDSSGETSCKRAVATSGFDDLDETEKQADLADHYVSVEYLCCLFPNLSMDSLVGLLDAHDGDLEETIDILNELEGYDRTSEELAEVPQISKDWSAGFDKGSSSGTDGST